MANNLTSGKLLFKNTIINMIGKLFPILLAVLSTPWIMGQLGEERYGFFALCWVIFGYLNLFDFGFGRALNRQISQLLAEEKHIGYAVLIVTVNRFQIAVGVFLGAMLWFLSPLVASGTMSVSENLQGESLTAIRVIALYIPFLLTFYSYSSVLESKQRFDQITLWQTVSSTLWYLVPAILVFYTTRIDIIISSLIFIRLLHWAVIRRLAWAELPDNDPRTGSFTELKSIFRFGGWIAADNLVAPFVSQIDKYIVGLFLGVVALGYYHASIEIVSKITIIPMAVAGVLYPALSYAFTADKDRADTIYAIYYNFTQLLVFPILMLIIWFGEEIITLWLSLAPTMSPEYKQQFIEVGIPVLRIFAVGVFFNCLAMLPLSYIQTMGRPDLTTKVHLLQLPVFTIAVYFGVKYYGLIGGAAVMSLRMFVDFLMMTTVVAWKSKGINTLKLVIIPSVIAFSGLLPGVIGIDGFWAKAVLIVSISVVFSGSVWRSGVKPEERKVVYEMLKKVFYQRG